MIGWNVRDGLGNPIGDKITETTDSVPVSSIVSRGQEFGIVVTDQANLFSPIVHPIGPIVVSLIVRIGAEARSNIEETSLGGALGPNIAARMIKIFGNTK